ncbi:MULTISPECIES: YkvA family protein [Clostridium]|uniref:YkvA family protein n=1 Tax=Clostridium TaxID=1485 RepID=UPI00257D3195|nr:MULTISPECIES: YkvA family protein [Clostridium]WRY53590.1 YkvA family protein [Clostridium intestinale]
MRKSYKNHYSENKLFLKLKKYATKAGAKVVYAILILFYAMKKPEISMKEKLIVIGALGYFIAPIDSIPDFIPLAGFTDDFGALMFALIKIARHVDDEVKEKAKNRLDSWFKNINEDDLIVVERRLFT